MLFAVTERVIDEIRSEINSQIFDPIIDDSGSTRYSITEYVYVVVFFVIAYLSSVGRYLRSAHFLLRYILRV